MARFIYEFLIPIFRDNMHGYLMFQIVFLIFLTISIYFLVLRLTKSKLISFTTCVIFSTNSGAIYEMMAEGNFNRFLDRVPNLIISVIALIYLVKFLEKRNKKRDLYIAYFLFAVGTYLGHYASFMFPFFVLYTIASYFNKKSIIKSLINGIKVAIPFLIVTLVIAINSDQKSGFPISYYLNPQSRYLEKIFYMLIPLIVPNQLVMKLASIWPSGPILRPYIPIVAVVTAFLIAISILIGIYFYRKNKNTFLIYSASIFSILIQNAFMIYTDPIKYDPFKYFDPGRQLFIQSIFYSIVLSMILVTFLKRSKKYSLPILLLLLTVFVIHNTQISWKNISDTQYLYEANKKYLIYIRSLFPKFNDDTVVVVGPRLMQMSTFVDYFYSPPNVTFASAPEDIAVSVKNDKKNVFVMDVDYNVTTDGKYLPERVKIIDLSPYYQSGKLSLSEWGTKHIKDYEVFYNIK